jgi:predicted transcriptional regulator
MKGTVTQTVLSKPVKSCKSVVKNLEADYSRLKPSKSTMHRPVNRLRATGLLCRKKQERTRRGLSEGKLDLSEHT